VLQHQVINCRSENLSQCNKVTDDYHPNVRKTTQANEVRNLKTDRE